MTLDYLAGKNIMLLGNCALLFLFSILTCPHYTNGYILRTQCQNAANFSIERDDMVLRGFVIDEFKFINLDECKARCLFDVNCKSVNYQKERDNICQLNSITTEDVRYRINLLPEKGWKYLTTDYRYTKVGYNCQNYSPCPDEILCMDTCQCPGYQCMHCQSHQLGLNCQNPWRDCEDVRKAGYTQNGIYDINPNRQPKQEFSVYCDFETENKAWIVIQRRRNASISFERNWENYASGFGNLHGNVWLGLEKLYQLTNAQGRYAVLRVELMSHGSNEKKFAEYGTFSVSGKDDFYRLSIGNYRSISNVVDSMLNEGYNGFLNLHGMQFSTFDNDNDKSTGSCAQIHHGGWWYNNCFAANLNGLYYSETSTFKAAHMSWYDICSCFGSLTFSEMKISYT